MSVVSPPDAESDICVLGSKGMSEFGSRSAPKSFAQRRLESLLTDTGVTFNGNQPWDIQVLDPQLYSTLLLNGSLSLGEGYMNGS